MPPKQVCSIRRAALKCGTAWFCWAICGVLLLGYTACSMDEWQPTEFDLRESPTALPLRAITFANSDTGYAVGGREYSDGIILRSTDGGYTWAACMDNATLNKTLYDLSIRADGRVWASAFDSKILYSDNSGATWQIIQTSAPDLAWQPLRAMAWTSDSTATIVGGQATFTGVSLLLDAHSQTAQYQTLVGQLNDIAYVAPTNTLYACGYGVAYKSADGGQTWQNMELRGDEWVAICFPSPDVGYVAGRQGSLYKTIDGGNTWQNLHRESVWSIGGRHQFNALLFVSDTEGWVAGDGLLWRTQDGGNTWQSYKGSDIDHYHLNALALGPNGEIWAVGDNGIICRIAP